MGDVLNAAEVVGTGREQIENKIGNLNSANQRVSDSVKGFDKYTD